MSSLKEMCWSPGVCINAVVLSPGYTKEALGGALKNSGAEPPSQTNSIRISEMVSQESIFYQGFPSDSNMKPRLRTTACSHEGSARLTSFLPPPPPPVGWSSQRALLGQNSSHSSPGFMRAICQSLSLVSWWTNENSVGGWEGQLLMNGVDNT